MDRLLLIDDSSAFRDDVEAMVQGKFQLVTASSGRRGLELLRTENVAAVLLDLQLPDIPGSEVIETIHRDIDPWLPVIVVTEQSDTEHAVTSMRLGAYDFISKGFSREVLSAKIMKALERRRLELSVRALQTTFADHHDRMVFASDEMKKLHFEISRLAPLGFDVLIEGETGVGKDLTAFELHNRSPRRDRPFISIALRSLSESLIESELFGHEKGAFSGAEKTKIGKFEAANGGTVYIPEISCLSESVQLKLLQFLQYKTISRVGQDSRKPETRLDVRVIMATNESLEEQVRRGRMREDFYHRITGITIHIPPLRERVGDMEALIKYFLRKYALDASQDEITIAPELRDALKAYHWPGNVRELENAVKSAVASGPTQVLKLEHFPRLNGHSTSSSQCSTCLAKRSSPIPTYRSAEEEFRRAYYAELMQRSGGSIAVAARTAGITTQGLRKALHTLGLAPA